MTKTKDESKPEVLLSRLNGAYNEISAIAVAASSCCTNLTWLSLNQRVHVPMVDFDVVCGILPTVAMQDIYDSFIESHESPEYVPRSFMGVHTIRQLLRGEQEYCLPPGSVGEVLQRTEKISGSLSSFGRAFIERMEKAKDSDDPLQVILHGSSSWEVLLDEIKGREALLSDAVLLGEVQRHSRDWSEYVEDVPDLVSRRIFRMVLSFLEYSRVGEHRNNFYDALNLQALVRICRNPSRENRQRPLPVLISHTQLLNTSLKTIEPQLGLDQGHGPHPILLSDHVYWAVESILLHQAEQDVRLAAINADLLCHDAEQVTECYRSLLHAVEPTGTVDKVVDSPAWKRAAVMRERFDEVWGKSLEKGFRLGVHDRLDIVNRFLSSEVRKLSTKQNPAELRATIADLVNVLRQQRLPNIELWYPHMIYESTELVVETYPSPPKWILLTYDDNRSPLLGNLKPGRSIDDLKTQTIAMPYCFRMLVHLEYCQRGAVFVVQVVSEESDPSKYVLKFVWPSFNDVEEIWNSGVQFFHVATTNNTKNLNLVAHDDSREYRRRFSLEQQQQELRTLLTKLPMVQLIEITASAVDISVVADIRPVNDIEVQIGIRIPRDQWQEDYALYVATFMTRSTYIGLDRTVIRATIARILAIIDVQLGRTEGKSNAALSE